MRRAKKPLACDWKSLLRKVSPTKSPRWSGVMAQTLWSLMVICVGYCSMFCTKKEPELALELVGEHLEAAPTPSALRQLMEAELGFSLLGCGCLARCSCASFDPGDLQGAA